MRCEVAIGLLLLTSGCGSSRMPEVRPQSGGGNELEISRVIEEALEADGRAERADSLYAPYATVIADGRARRGPPRFAGIARQGEVAITNTQLQTRGTTSWGNLEYRWVSGSSNQARVGHASFVLAPAPHRTGWWIVQLHSSTAR
jgi:hypothetical protein